MSTQLESQIRHDKDNGKLKYPLIGLLLQKTGDTDDEDIRIITDIYRRDAINFKSRLCFARLTIEPVEKMADMDNVAEKIKQSDAWDETICETCPCFSTTIDFLPILMKISKKLKKSLTAGGGDDNIS